MYNPITFIKDIIDLLRNPPGEAVAASEIVPENFDVICDALGPRGKEYAKVGHFFLELENNTTVVPPGEFHKHYAFDAPTHPTMLTRVRTIKPL